MTRCRFLTYMAQLSMEQGAILPKQYEQITQKVYEVMNLLGAWIKSDEKRYWDRVVHIFGGCARRATMITTPRMSTTMRVYAPHRLDARCVSKARHARVLRQRNSVPFPDNGRRGLCGLAFLLNGYWKGYKEAPYIQ